jgi:type I restriction enzyme S subunit
VAYKIGKIKDYLTQVKREVVLDDSTSYKLLGVRWYGEGVFLREEKNGKSISAKKLYKVKEGDFVYNRLFAWKSSFAIVSKEFDGCLVSNEFPVFTYNQQQSNPFYLLSFVLQPDFIHQVNNLSGGMSSVSRKRLKEIDFLNAEIPLLTLPDQNKIVNYFKGVEDDWACLKSELTHQQTLLKKLRQQILQEAIEGKLTADWRAQNPDVEPASELLKRIAAEKAQLVKDKKIKAQKPLPPITDEEKPFDLPQGWEWCRLGEIILKACDGPHVSPEYSDVGIPFISTRNISPTGIDFSSSKYVTTEYSEILNKKCKPEQWDILYTKGGTTGIARVNDCEFEFNVWVHVAVLKKPREIHPFYIQHLLNSPHCYVQSQKYTRGIGNQDLGLIRMVKITTPLPPLLEQQAIVTKVEKLLALCDQLETQITQNQTHAEQLMQAVLKEAFSYNSAAEPAAARKYLR